MVLEAPARIHADRLQTAPRRRRNTHLSPGRRKRQGADSLQRFLLHDPLPTGIHIAESTLFCACSSPPSGSLAPFYENTKIMECCRFYSHCRHVAPSCDSPLHDGISPPEVCGCCPRT